MSDKLISIGKGALIAGAGAALTYLAEILPNLDFGEWTAVVAAVLAVLVNIFRKMIVR